MVPLRLLSFKAALLNFFRSSQRKTGDGHISAQVPQVRVFSKCPTRTTLLIPDIVFKIWFNGAQTILLPMAVFVHPAEKMAIVLKNFQAKNEKISAVTGWHRAC